MTIIEQIKAEIERLKKAQEVSEDKDYAQYELDVACGYDMACDDILSFLSTLESEKPIIPNDLEEAAKEYAKTTFKKPYSDNPDEEVTIVEPDKYAGFIAGARHEDEQLSEKVAAAYQLGLADKEKQIMSEAVEGWVAVDSDIYGKRRVTFFPQKPVRDVLTEYKYWAATRPRYESIKLDSNAFPSLKWEDEPKKVKLIIVKED